MLDRPESSDQALTKRLNEVFGLTPSEAAVALLIGNGRSPADIAGERQVSVDTVRSQLKAVSAKLGCSRQAEIAAVVQRWQRTRIANK
jgi:DNA-binding CsgD family transcriptional regulator